MSTFSVSWALNSVQCKSLEKVILIALAERSDDFGRVDAAVTQADLASKACTTVRTVQRKLKELAREGVLDVYTKQIAREQRRNTYLLHVEHRFNLLLQAAENGIGDSVSPISRENNATECRLSDEKGDSVSPISREARQSVAKIDDTAMSHGNKYIQNNISKTNTALPTAIVEMSVDWSPSQNILEMLKDEDSDFLSFCLDLFKAFWINHPRSKQSQGRFDQNFLKHVNVNRARWSSTPRPIEREWMPDPISLQELGRLGIPSWFVERLVPEFILYWIDRGAARESWNKVFMKHCQKQYQFEFDREA